MNKRIWKKKSKHEEESVIRSLTDKINQLEEENLALHSIIDSYLAKENEEKTVTKDSISEYEEWLDSPEADMLAKAYEPYVEEIEEAKRYEEKLIKELFDMVISNPSKEDVVLEVLQQQRMLESDDEVAVEEESTQYSEDAKDRMAQSHLWL